MTVHTDKSLKLKRLWYFAARRRDWFSVGVRVGQAPGAAAGQRLPDWLQERDAPGP